MLLFFLIKKRKKERKERKEKKIYLDKKLKAIITKYN